MIYTTVLNRYFKNSTASNISPQFSYEAAVAKIQIVSMPHFSWLPLSAPAPCKDKTETRNAA